MGTPKKSAMAAAASALISRERARWELFGVDRSALDAAGKAAAGVSLRKPYPPAEPESAP